jgi:hypothetical protein
MGPLDQMLSGFSGGSGRSPLQDVLVTPAWRGGWMTPDGQRPGERTVPA